MPKIAIVLLALALVGCNDKASNVEPETPESPQQPTPPPEISSFTASASSITEGDSVTLLPVFSGGSGRIDNGVGAVTSDEPVSVSPSATTTYTLTVTNDAGDSVPASVDVTVEPPPITINIVAPRDGQLVGAELLVAATLKSEFDISAVTAETEDRDAPLEFSEDAICDVTLGCRPGFTGELSLTGLPPGPYVVTVTAEDVTGNVVSRQRSFVLDEKPILTVAEPADHSVARPELPAEVSCSDDLGDCVITVWNVSSGREQLASAVNELSDILDLSEFEGREIGLEFAAEDTAGQRSLTKRTIYVDSSARLTNERQFSALVVDFDGQRALLEATAADSSQLTIVDVDSGSATIVEVPENTEIVDAFLSPTGAIYVGKDGSTFLVYDWNNSLLIELGTANSARSLDVAGDYAIWNDGADLWRRQLSTMTDLQVSGAAGNFRNSVANNGVVAFWGKPGGETHYQIAKLDGGATTTLTADADRDNLYVETDGQDVVYLKRSAAGYAITFHDGTNETILTAFREAAPVAEPVAGRDYSIAGGWVAYTELGGLGQTHVWTRDPSGALLQRTVFGSDSWIEELSPDGEVMLRNSNRRYLSLPTGEVTEVSAALGQSTRIGDTWYVSIGRSLFEVQ